MPRQRKPRNPLKNPIVGDVVGHEDGKQARKIVAIEGPWIFYVPYMRVGMIHHMFWRRWAKDKSVLRTGEQDSDDKTS